MCPWGHLSPGKRYTVVAEFLDFDGDKHTVGETWTYLGHAFLPYEDGLSLFVSLNGQEEWHIRLQARPDQQEDIVANLAAYIQAA